VVSGDGKDISIFLISLNEEQSDSVKIKTPDRWIGGFLLRQPVDKLNS